jgi:transposase
MRQMHKAGEKLFVDYAGATIPLYERGTNNVILEAQIFVGVLGASNYTYVEATPSQELKHWLGSHQRCFEFLGGVPKVAVPDNLKSGVTKASYYDPEINPAYHNFAQHCGIAIVPARVKKPKDKAKVEVGVQIVERWIIAVLRNRRFFSLHELNQEIARHLEKLNTRLMKSYGCSRRERLVLAMPVLFRALFRAAECRGSIPILTSLMSFSVLRLILLLMFIS